LKIIEPSYEIINAPADALQRVEAAGRTCYKSEERIGPETAGPFVRMLREQTGGTVGRARIVDCVTRSDSPWFVGRYGFVLEGVEPLPFRAVSGNRGLFDLPDWFGEGA
jgi:hypothetical protein